MITQYLAKRLAAHFGLDLKVVSLKWWTKGLQIELEHGLTRGWELTNVTNDDLVMTAKIALAHILEYPDYYKRLTQMEKAAEKYWSSHKKPNVLNE